MATSDGADGAAVAVADLAPAPAAAGDVAARARARLGYAPHPTAERGVLVGGSRFEGGGAVRFTLDLLDLDQADTGLPSELQALPLRARVERAERGLRRLSLGFLPHGMALHPRHPTRALWFEKWGDGAAFVDLAEGLLLGKPAPLPGHQFYGHGAFSPDGALAYCVETELGSGRGVISVRDASASGGFAPLGELPSHGMKPHDCVLLLPEKLLAVTNGAGDTLGTPGRVCLIEVETGKLVEQLEVPDRQLNTGHLTFDSARNLAVVSAPRDGLPDSHAGGLSLRGWGAPFRTLPRAARARMQGETLSVCIDEARALVWATSPRGAWLTIWSGAGELRRGVELKSPRGVALSLDERVMYVTCGAGSELMAFDPDELMPLERQPSALRVFGGSHVYAWAPPAP
ncbi:MAG: DUF1513 domain-containing protein [Polyangiaceae bacterium]|nr:DUF1513 domain-containing protein [Polyangiaceae bacterium]MCW5791300.1 DUF1513 domain-containing protein [Polyangiaceae bacterium]